MTFAQLMAARFWWGPLRRLEEDKQACQDFIQQTFSQTLDGHAACRIANQLLTFAVDLPTTVFRQSYDTITTPSN